MVKLKYFFSSELLTSDELEIKQEIFDKYKYALLVIGVEFSDENIQEALMNCDSGFEDALRATIAYWYWLRNRGETFYANSCLLSAIRHNWSSRYWRDEYLDNPDFKNPCELFWEDAAEYLGYDLRNQAIIDTKERDDGDIYILFCSGTTLRLTQAQRNGWNWLKQYAQQQIEEKFKKEMMLQQFNI
jgi:hypothetical protein